MNVIVNPERVKQSHTKIMSSRAAKGIAAVPFF